MKNSLKIKFVYLSGLAVSLMFLCSNSGCDERIGSKVDDPCLTKYFNFLEKSIVSKDSVFDGYEDKFRFNTFKISEENFMDSLAYYAKKCIIGKNVVSVTEGMNLGYSNLSDNNYVHANIYNEEGRTKFLLYQVNPNDGNVISAKLGALIPMKPRQTH